MPPIPQRPFVVGFKPSYLIAAIPLIVLSFWSGLDEATAITKPLLDSNQRVLIENLKTETIQRYSDYYTHGAHLAGLNRSQAAYTRDSWQSSGINSSIFDYNVFINYPLDKSVTLTYPNGSIFAASLEEGVYPEDETTPFPNRTPVFHGYSASDNVSGPLIYAAYGRPEDYQLLVDRAIDLTGGIAIVKYGGPFRGLKVQLAQQHNMSGVLIYTDPGDDGYGTKSMAPYPEGGGRNPTSVQRGSVQFLSIYPGDPTTPGYPSHEGVPRSNTTLSIPQIPSIPMSYLDALPMLTALEGSGFPASDLNSYFGGGLNITYYTGPASGVSVDLYISMNDTYSDIWDTIGIINGTTSDVIVVGNHRDAWIIGGAADANSGSATYGAVVEAFGALLKTGWRPKRTIVFASWDGEEYGLLGSTEWVEEHVGWLNASCVAYLNVDVAVSGPRFKYSAVPELHSIMETVLKLVDHPRNGTVYDVWKEESGNPGVLGSGSDYTAFIHEAGIPSLDFGFVNGPTDPVYHYHSNYDSYHWMTTYGDPGWLYHLAAAKVVSLLLYSLADSDVLPFNVSQYTTSMMQYRQSLDNLTTTQNLTLDTSSLGDAIKDFGSSVEKFERAGLSADEKNQRYKLFERRFIQNSGLPGRPFYKHLIYAPGKDTGYAAKTFPGITEAVQNKDLSLAQEFMAKTADAIRKAGAVLHSLA